jgi:hypothetical protein
MMGLVTGGHRDVVTTLQINNYFLFKTMITSYKNRRSKPAKSGIGCYKINLKALQSYKSLMP